MILIKCQNGKGKHGGLPLRKNIMGISPIIIGHHPGNFIFLNSFSTLATR